MPRNYEVCWTVFISAILHEQCTQISQIWNCRGDLELFKETEHVRTWCTGHGEHVYLHCAAEDTESSFFFTILPINIMLLRRGDGRRLDGDQAVLSGSRWDDFLDVKPLKGEWKCKAVWQNRLGRYIIRTYCPITDISFLVYMSCADLKTFLLQMMMQKKDAWGNL